MASRFGNKLKKVKLSSSVKPSCTGFGATLYMKENLSDITIHLTKCGTVWRFPAHSYVLASQSTVLNRMLDADFKENSTREILFQDMSPYILKKFLRYMYIGDAEFENWNEALKLLKVAHMYEVKSLVQECDTYLQEHVDLSNVCCLYSKANVYNLQELCCICLEVILSTACIVLRSQEFELLNKESVITVISSAKLNVDSEMCVVDAVLRWAITECSRQNKPLKEVNISEIMIPFGKYLNTAEIETDELFTLPQFMCFAIKNTFPRENFCVNTHLLRYAKYVPFKIVDTKSLEYNFESFNFFRFRVDLPVFLIGVRLIMRVRNFNLLDDELCQYDFVKLYDDSDPTDVLGMGFVKSPGTSILSETSDFISEIEVLFDRPVYLQPNMQYRLSLCRNKCRNPKREGKIFFYEVGALERNGDCQSGSVPFNILAGSSYGVGNLLYLNAPVCSEASFLV